MVLWSHAIAALRRTNPDVAEAVSEDPVVTPVIDSFSLVS